MCVEVKVGELIDKVFAGFKKITPALIVLDIVSGCVLFLPQSFLAIIGLENIPNVWRIILGLIFLSCSAMIIVILLSPCVRKIKEKYKAKKQWKTLEKLWIGLSDDKKAVVCTLLNEPEKSGYLVSTSGITIYLQNVCVISRPQQHMYVDYDDLPHQRFVYCLQPWVIDLFEKKPELFDMNLINKDLIQPPAVEQW